MLLGLVALLVVVAMAAQPGVTAGAAAGFHSGAFGAVDPASGLWSLHQPGGEVATFYYGNPGDEPFLGDWDCDGVATPGLFRRSDGFVYLRNSNTQGTADVEFYFGNPGDLPLPGDFDGDGCDTVSVFRPAEQRVYVIDRLGSHGGGLGAADRSFPFGDPGDVALAGDFDGDGVDTVAGFRPSSNLVFVYSPTGGSVVETYSFGDPGDRPVVAPLQSGRDEVALFRPAQPALHFRASESHGPWLLEMPWASAGWRPIAGPTGHATAVTPPPAPPSPPAWNTLTDTVVFPGESIQRAVEANPPGAVFTIKAGTHRLQQVIPKPHQTFEGEPGAILNGSRLLTEFGYAGGLWYADGQTQQGEQKGECLPVGGVPTTACRHPENVYFDDEPLRQVMSPSALGPGRFYFDYGADRIYLADNPAGHKVEASVTRHAFYFWRSDPGWRQHNYPTGVNIRNLVIEKYANPSQRGAIQAGGFNTGAAGEGLTEGWVIEFNEIRLNHGAGVRTGNRTLLRGNHIHHNGQIGVRATGDGAVVEDNEIDHNNTLGFDPDWEAGGTKFWKTRNVVVRGNHVHHNTGPGLWTDTDNVDTIYESNVVEDNTGPGIFHEISYSAVIRYNTVKRNGLSTADWFYGAGILIAHSSGVEVHNNVLEDNADGIAGIDQGRGGGALGPWRLDQLDVHDNVIHLPTGWTGVGQDIGDNSVFDRDIAFYRNSYVLGSQARPFKWQNTELTPAQWQSYGHDPEGWFT